LNSPTNFAELIILLLLTGCKNADHKYALPKAEKAIEDRNYSKAEQFARQVVKNTPAKRKAEMILSYHFLKSTGLPKRG